MSWQGIIKRGNLASVEEVQQRITQVLRDAGTNPTHFKDIKNAVQNAGSDGRLRKILQGMLLDVNASGIIRREKGKYTPRYYGSGKVNYRRPGTSTPDSYFLHESDNEKEEKLQ